MIYKYSHFQYYTLKMLLSTKTDTQILRFQKTEGLLSVKVQGQRSYLFLGKGKMSGFVI